MRAGEVIGPDVLTLTRLSRATIATGTRVTMTRAEFAQWLAAPKIVDVPSDASPATLKVAKVKHLDLWSPATFIGDHRAKAYVETVFAIGFDLDKDPCVPIGRASDLLSDYACTLHTTFSHREDAPRLRAIVWPSRVVTAKEYDLLWGWLAEQIRELGIGVGKEARDPSRAWFAPARASWGTHEVRETGGSLVDVDAVLAAIESSKPKAKVKDLPLRLAYSQSDEMRRARAYVDKIDPAIEGQGGSDRAHYAACQIVRMVRSEHDQERLLAEYNLRCEPPWSEKELAHKLESARAKESYVGLPDREKPSSGAHGAASAPTSDRVIGCEDPPEEIEFEFWKGSPASTAENVSRFLRTAPGWGGGPKLDRFADCVRWPDPLPAPLREIQRTKNALSKYDYPAIASACLAYGLAVGVDTVELGVKFCATKNNFDSLVEYMRSLPAWDGVRRLESWICVYLGCEDTAYHRVSGRAFLRAAAARAIEPGCVVDIVPILEGDGGAGKNYAIQILFGDRQSTLGNWDPDKDAIKRLAIQTWVLHDDEFESRRAREIASLKSWVSRTEERWVPKYSNDVFFAPRRALLVCSTNHVNYLTDPTGNRRWYPWRVGRVDHEALERDRDQLLAEALADVDAHGVACWREGLTEVAGDHKEATETARAEDTILDSLRWLVSSGKWGEYGASASALAELLGIPPERADAAFSVRLGLAVREMGGHIERRGGGASKGGKRRVYYPPIE